MYRHEHASRERWPVEAEDLNWQSFVFKCLCPAKWPHASRVSLVVSSLSFVLLFHIRARGV